MSISLDHALQDIITTVEMKYFVVIFISLIAGLSMFQFTLMLCYRFCTLVGIHSGLCFVPDVYGACAILLSNYTSTSCFFYILQINKISICDSEIALHPAMLLCTTLCAIIVYSISRGKPSNLTPSHISHPGAFARQYVTVDNKGVVPSPSMKQRIQELGGEYGCHHCGSFEESYISDHMPPTVLYTDRSVLQRLYPQCRTCSMFQGGTLSGGGEQGWFYKRGVVYYSWRVRPWLFWVPYYVIIEWMFGASENLKRDTNVLGNLWGLLS